MAHDTTTTTGDVVRAAESAARGEIRESLWEIRREIRAWYAWALPMGGNALADAEYECDAIRDAHDSLASLARTRNAPPRSADSAAWLALVSGAAAVALQNARDAHARARAAYGVGVASPSAADASDATTGDIGETLPLPPPVLSVPGDAVPDDATGCYECRADGRHCDDGHATSRALADAIRSYIGHPETWWHTTDDVISDAISHVARYESACARAMASQVTATLAYRHDYGDVADIAADDVARACER